MALLLFCFLELSKHSYSDFDLLYFLVEEYFFCVEESTHPVMPCIMMFASGHDNGPVSLLPGDITVYISTIWC